MRQGKVIAIYVGPVAREPMLEVAEVLAITDAGLEGDRYCRGEGSYSKGVVGRRQVTLMNARFFLGSGFKFGDARRNIFTDGIELMDLIGREFEVGAARFLGERYCDPCLIPQRSSGEGPDFRDTFHDRGGLIAKIIQGGLIRRDDRIVGPPKNY